ncbi:MAG: hypothetical protein AMQ22_02019 [Candidatus Methanofastidiosum methylothiophilum]|uniref:Uncharacterized protein n=1 Tax=Candidatus Methanofastidiosum methylothiophilum TaxID=1705564 RepID=A0A150IQ81_9EURY|nr:MAG: hypothetical protein AMQ22_02019 [Candidatus Methanofastidiosum methylthiophilus]
MKKMEFDLWLIPFVAGFCIFIMGIYGQQYILSLIGCIISATAFIIEYRLGEVDISVEVEKCIIRK